MVASSNHDSFISSGNEGDCADNKISKQEQLNGGHSFFHFLNKTFSRLCSRLKINKLALQGKEKMGQMGRLPCTIYTTMCKIYLAGRCSVMT